MSDDSKFTYHFDYLNRCVYLTQSSIVTFISSPYQTMRSYLDLRLDIDLNVPGSGLALIIS